MLLGNMVFQLLLGQLQLNFLTGLEIIKLQKHLKMLKMNLELVTLSKLEKPFINTLLSLILALTMKKSYNN